MTARTRGRAGASPPRRAARGISTIDIAADPRGVLAAARAPASACPRAPQLIGVTGWDERVYLAAALRERRHAGAARDAGSIDRMFEWRIA